MKTREIGSLYRYGKITLEVVVAEDGCRNCYFDGNMRLCSHAKKITGYCSEAIRRDKIHVIFKKVEK